MNSEIDTLLVKLDAHPTSLIFARVASAYLQTEKVNQAIQICEQGLSHHVGYVTGHMVMSTCYFKVGLLEQAITECQYILEQDTEHMAALHLLGDIYIEQKKFDRARTAYQKVLQLDPGNRCARERLTHIQSHMKNSDKGLETNQAEDDDKTSLETSIVTPTLADIYASQGLTDRALNVLRRLLGSTSNKEEIVGKIRELEEELLTTHRGGDHGHDG